MAKKKELEKAGLAILQAAINANKTQNAAAGIGAGLRAVAQGKTPAATPSAVRTPPAVKANAPSGGLNGQAAQVANTIGKFVPAVKPAVPQSALPGGLSGLTMNLGGAVNGLAAATVPAVKPAAPQSTLPGGLSGLTIRGIPRARQLAPGEGKTPWGVQFGGRGAKRSRTKRNL